MCLLAIYYRKIAGAPLLVAANREEFLDRPFLPPCVQGQRCRFLAGVDARAGGTWLGVNQQGLLVAVTNRPKSAVPDQPRSRGLLCRDLLERAAIGDAFLHVRRELTTGHYAGANFVVADTQQGILIEAGDELRETPLVPGKLHLVTNGPADNPRDPRQALAREMFAADAPDDVSTFLSTARRVCRQGADAEGRSIVVRCPDRGTVSSTLVAVTLRPDEAVYEFAPGSPDVTPYANYSAAFCELLRSRRDSTV